MIANTVMALTTCIRAMMQRRYTGLWEVAHCRCLAVCTLSLPVSSADGIDAAECTLNRVTNLSDPVQTFTV